MNTDLLLVLALLFAAVVMFVINRPRMDAVALIMIVVLPFTGVITMGEALAGFSDPNIVLIAALFVMGEGLVRTGVAQRLGDWLAVKAGNSETRLLILLMLAVGILGSVMSSTGVIAIFIPVAIRIAQSTGMSASRLMMPMSVAALISGMMTLVGTAPNLVVNSELIRQGFEGFHFFSMTPFGSIILVFGILYMLFARRWLASSSGGESKVSRRPTLLDWVQEYKLAAREQRVRVPNRSPLVGKTIRELDLRNELGVSIIAIDRRFQSSRKLLSPTPNTEIQADDILFIDFFRGDSPVGSLWDKYALEMLPLTGEYFTDRSQEIGMAEVMLGANSELADKTITESHIRTRFGLTVIGLRRGKDAYEGNFLAEKLQVGDTLLVLGTWKQIQSLQTDASRLVILNLPVELDQMLPAPDKAPHAIACLLLMVGLMISGIIPNVQAALIACLLMGALRCVDFESAYRCIHWKSLILIVGMLPFSLALQRTGGVDLAAEALMATIGYAGPHVVLGSVFLITAMLGLFISNTATAVLMAPIALAIANDMGASPYPFAMIVALAASTAFMTPISSPVNTLVVVPGNYKFGDFVKIGVPFSFIVMLVSVILVPLLLPLY
ncbi:SLC13 family permease [Desulfonatronum thioautotrophicum]|uniref:SLC13 family permease n=1 Tax=Desulfonatronum thioautotrophicum TaxID=617001 RepID=UPI0005EBCF5C|nr:SLC13 family permease [Desulfonatronum thioautotrophicum]